MKLLVSSENKGLAWNVGALTNDTEDYEIQDFGMLLSTFYEFG
jgi:hypothetical protein